MIGYPSWTEQTDEICHHRPSYAIFILKKSSSRRGRDGPWIGACNPYQQYTQKSCATPPPSYQLHARKGKLQQRGCIRRMNYQSFWRRTRSLHLRIWTSRVHLLGLLTGDARITLCTTGWYLIRFRPFTKLYMSIKIFMSSYNIKVIIILLLGGDTRLTPKSIRKKNRISQGLIFIDWGDWFHYFSCRF